MHRPGWVRATSGLCGIYLKGSDTAQWSPQALPPDAENAGPTSHTPPPRPSRWFWATREIIPQVLRYDAKMQLTAWEDVYGTSVKMVKQHHGPRCYVYKPYPKPKDTDELLSRHPDCFSVGGGIIGDADFPLCSEACQCHVFSVSMDYSHKSYQHENTHE